MKIHYPKIHPMKIIHAYLHDGQNTSILVQKFTKESVASYAKTITSTTTTTAEENEK